MTRVADTAANLARLLGSAAVNGARYVNTRREIVVHGNPEVAAETIADDLMRAGNAVAAIGKAGAEKLRASVPLAKTAAVRLAGRAGEALKTSRVADIVSEEVLGRIGDLGEGVSKGIGKLGDSPEAILFALRSQYVPSEIKLALLPRLTELFKDDKLTADRYVATLKDIAVAREDNKLAEAAVKALAQVASDNGDGATAALFALLDVARFMNGRNEALAREAFEAILANALKADFGETKGKSFLFDMLEFIRDSKDPRVAIAFFDLLQKGDASDELGIMALISNLARIKAEEFGEHPIYGGYFRTVVEKFGGQADTQDGGLKPIPEPAGSSAAQAPIPEPTVSNRDAVIAKVAAEFHLATGGAQELPSLPFGPGYVGIYRRDGSYVSYLGTVSYPLNPGAAVSESDIRTQIRRLLIDTGQVVLEASTG